MNWPKGKPRPPQRRDLTGKTFSRLVVVAPAPERANKRAYWICQCSCGKQTEASASDLVTEHVKSCGCLQKETNVLANTKHGYNRTPTYISWCSMWARCSNSKLTSFKNYGGRGISVCERWKSFEAFLVDMGERPIGKSIDRYPNNDGNYEPGNCRRATASEQRRNQRPVSPVRAAAAIGEAMT